MPLRWRKWTFQIPCMFKSLSVSVTRFYGPSFDGKIIFREWVTFSEQNIYFLHINNNIYISSPFISRIKSLVPFSLPFLIIFNINYKSFTLHVNVFSVKMRGERIPLFMLYTLTLWQLINAIRVISNGLAPPEIVHSPMDAKPRCLLRAAPLDLVFILDSSGSLRNQFQDEIEVIRRIVQHVTIGDTATRVMLIQFSGVQHLEFDFNKFTRRDELLSALDVLRHVSGITRVGGAFEFAISVLENVTHGIRPSAVPKIVFLLSDGRTHDFPTDSEMAEKLRKRVPNLDIWAYGTGEYVAMTELMKITKNESKIITNKNLEKIQSLFAPWHGVEVCEQRPVCVKGSDKPLDLALLIDSSESINQVFQAQVQFTIDRIISNIHVHSDAVRLALITFSGQTFVHFGFNDPKVGNNSAVIRYLNTLRPIKGTTAAHLALAAALRLFNDPIQNSLPKRTNASKLVLVFSDGRISEPVEKIAEMLRSIGVETMAVSLNHPTNSNERELLAIAGRKEHVFTQGNLQDFEKTFLKFVGFGCDGFELGVNATPRIRGATDVTCGPDSLTLTVRTTKPMHGLIYAHRFHDDPHCVLRTDGANRENSLTFQVGRCGVQRTPLRDNSAQSGYLFNVTVILQFHPIIVTRADQGLDVSCVHHQPVSQKELELASQQFLVASRCSYRLHRFGPDNCIALDAKVGESLFHRWECETGDDFRFLVHDCYATSERNNVQILDENGCEIDPHFIETPDYSQMLLTQNNESGPKLDSRNFFVSQGMAAFKFPDDDNLLFRCLISLCDMRSSDDCTQMIPPKCDAKAISTTAGVAGPTHFRGSANISMFAFDGADIEGPKKRQRRRSDVGGEMRQGFARTVAVETRTLNVIESEGIRPPTAETVRYCDVRN